ncbi:MAG: hypothetical protein PSU93_10915 [Methylobacter sp.]|uniref:ATP-binding protein n=1 Tax=Candidatus Methylobacter titanis TaxID=3053457 RepID=A0AA43Q4U7_9GAMM|nr:hypothetical protein [Candidatus Methylobacter titanis]
MPELVVHVSERERDLRTHENRLLALREAFGELKAKAIQANKVNECSLTKVAKKAGVNKMYLTGNKQFAETGVADRYRAIGQAVLKFREDFQAGKISSDDENKTKALEAELAKVKASVHPYFLELQTSKFASEFLRDELKKAENSNLLLRAKILEMSERQGVVSSSVKSAIAFTERLVRTVISPDKHLIVNGEYLFRDENLQNQSWLKSYDELEEALGRTYSKRLYVLVGLPCSGKTTWAEKAELYPDRHPIIFDATNLTRYERESLVHRFKRFSNVRKCCVYFDTPMTVIRDRNSNNRTRDKQLSNEELDVKMNKLQLPDPYKEKWIDEMIVIRDDE